MTDHLHLFVCDNFSEEARQILTEKHFADVDLAIFPSCCGHPPVSKDQILRLAGNETGAPSVCLFGSCCAAELKGIAKDMQYFKVHHLDQCFYLVCSKAMVDDMIKQGAYLLTPGWLSDWPEKIKMMGFNKEIAQEFFGQSAKKLVFLDTGVKKDSFNRLKEFSEFVGLPCETVPVGLDHMQLILNMEIANWRQTVLQNELNVSRKSASDSVMAMDLLGRMASLSINQDPVDNIKELFFMLFAPQKIVYTPFPIDFSDTDNCSLSDITSQASFWDEVKKFGFRLTDSKNGFYLALYTPEQYFGILKVDQVVLPANIEKYLNLALIIIKVCSLAMNNSSITRKLKSEILEKEKLVLELQEAIAQIKTLHGVIPICSYCKQLRNDSGAWTVLEDYIIQHSDAIFSHGICPDCFKKEMDKLDSEL